MNLNFFTFSYFINFQCKYTFELMMLKTRGVFLFGELKMLRLKQQTSTTGNENGFLKPGFDIIV